MHDEGKKNEKRDCVAKIKESLNGLQIWIEKSHKQIEEEGIGKENEKENGKLIDNDDRNNMNMIFIKTQLTSKNRHFS